MKEREREKKKRKRGRRRQKKIERKKKTHLAQVNGLTLIRRHEQKLHISAHTVVDTIHTREGIRTLLVQPFFLHFEGTALLCLFLSLAHITHCSMVLVIGWGVYCDCDCSFGARKWSETYEGHSDMGTLLSRHFSKTSEAFRSGSGVGGVF